MWYGEEIQYTHEKDDYDFYKTGQYAYVHLRQIFVCPILWLMSQISRMGDISYEVSRKTISEEHTRGE
jgi:hypothetical protein